MSDSDFRAVLVCTGLLQGECQGPPGYLRLDGSPARLERRADIIQLGPPDEPQVTQISRWDRLKDMPGVMLGFAHPVVASQVGGIRDQIPDDRFGLLLADPTDLAAFGTLVRRLLDDSQLATKIGRTGGGKGGPLSA